MDVSVECPSSILSPRFHDPFAWFGAHVEAAALIGPDEPAKVSLYYEAPLDCKFCPSKYSLHHENRSQIFPNNSGCDTP